MKHTSSILLMLVALFVLTACSDKVPFTIDNPSKATMVITIDNQEYSIGANSQEKVFLLPGAHKLSFGKLVDLQFMVYASLPKGGVINPSLSDYVVVSRSYTKQGIDSSSRTIYAIDPLSKKKLSFHHIKSQLFIDKTMTYSVGESLPDEVLVKGSTTNNAIRSALMTFDDFIKYVGKDLYQGSLNHRSFMNEDLFVPHYNETEILKLIPNFNDVKHKQKFQPLIEAGKTYLISDTSSAQKSAAKEMSQLINSTLGAVNHQDTAEREAWNETFAFTRALYTSAREMNISQFEIAKPSSTWTILKYTGYVLLVIIVLLLCGVIFTVLSGLFSKSEVRWYDKEKFDSTLRHFALTAASVYDNDIRVDSYKDISDGDRRTGETVLKDAWSTTNRTELLSTLESLRTDTHRGDQTRLAEHLSTLNEDEYKEYLTQLDEYDTKQAKLFYKQDKYNKKAFMAWDLLRFFFISHNGLLAGYIDVDEFDDITRPVIAEVQTNYQSWSDFFQHFLLGRQAWQGEGSGVNNESFSNRIDMLLKGDGSPCERVDWNVGSASNRPVSLTIMSDDSFWALIDSSNDGETTTFLPKLEGKLTQLSDDEIFHFKAKTDYLLETFGNPVYQYGASIVLNGKASPYIILIWLIFKGRDAYEHCLVRPEGTLLELLKTFNEEQRKNKHFMGILKENLRFFSLADSIYSGRGLNPMFKTLTFEERTEIAEQSLQRMSFNKTSFKRLLNEVT